MATSQPTPLLSPPPSWDSLSLTRRRRLLAVLVAMMLEALRAPPYATEVKDERRQR